MRQYLVGSSGVGPQFGQEPDPEHRGVGGAREIWPDGTGPVFVSQAFRGGNFPDDSEWATESSALRDSEIKRLRREVDESNRKTRRLDEALQERDCAKLGPVLKRLPARVLCLNHPTGQARSLLGLRALESKQHHLRPCRILGERGQRGVEGQLLLAFLPLGLGARPLSLEEVYGYVEWSATVPLFAQKGVPRGRQVHPGGAS
ncbi:uncharacterized protein A4U43_C06F11930 [Asparagus officinalis]|uniref:Uncharacterized protein n=1 Tax=Asparagus officinalis TaxID=4686 RepID=A0A5P1ELX3_ASPOF|nr:uncharacterized protein A4U43_C06F11930 [Asparagus officinalis]